MSRAVLFFSAVLIPVVLMAQSKPDCSALPDASRLRAAVQSVVKEGASKNGGLGNQEWAAIVNRDGVVCAIVFSGASRGDQWPGSRVIAAAKANTANGLSGNDYALSTANVFAASQPGQSLFSLATSAPPNANAVFGDPVSFGTDNDPMVGKAIGGIIVFGGGLPLYSSQGKIVGGSASVVTLLAPITLLPGKSDTHCTWTPSRWVQAPITTTI